MWTTPTSVTLTLAKGSAMQCTSSCGENLVCAGPGRSLAALAAQLHHPLPRDLKGLAERPAGVL